MKMSSKQEDGFYGWILSKARFQDLRDSGALFFGQYVWDESEQFYFYHRNSEQSPGRVEAVCQ